MTARAALSAPAGAWPATVGSAALRGGSTARTKEALALLPPFTLLVLWLGASVSPLGLAAWATDARVP